MDIGVDVRSDTGTICNHFDSKPVSYVVVAISAIQRQGNFSNDSQPSPKISDRSSGDVLSAVPAAHDFGIRLHAERVTLATHNDARVLPGRRHCVVAPFASPVSKALRSRCFEHGEPGRPFGTCARTRAGCLSSCVDRAGRAPSYAVSAIDGPFRAPASIAL